MDSNIATQRKEAGGKKLRADSFEKVHHENCLPLLLFLKNYHMNRQTLLIKDCLTLKTVSQKITMLLFILNFKASRLKWLFLSIFIISYWRSKTDKVTESDYSESRLLTKKGRARSLRPLDEFFIVMCRLRQGFPEDYLA